MAPRRRIDEEELYEGNGENIVSGTRERRRYSFEDHPSDMEERSTLPGKRPLGRDAGLKARDAYDRRMEEDTWRQQERYFKNNSDEQTTEHQRIFDDLNRYETREENRPVYHRGPKHTGLWATVTVFCLLLLTAMALFVLPQMTGIRYKFIPNLAFVNGNIIRLDEERTERFAADREAMYTGRIYPGIRIDGYDISGMTRDEAVAVLNSTTETPKGSFDLSVTVGNKIWHITNDTVPVTRNIEETVDQALSIGRNNSTAILNTGMTPFQERRNMIRELSATPVELITVATYDHKALKSEAEAIAQYVNREPVNSAVVSFDFGTLAFGFSDDVPGAYIDPDELFAKMTALLDSGDHYGSITAVPEKILADVTKTELMNGFRKISTYTTKTTSNKNRNTNVRLSAEAINGRTVMPGEIFSFNGTTGERTQERGYKEAAAISGGQSKDEIGGGVCQTSSTLFNAVARADLEIVERSPHAWPSSYVEKGMDATVNWPGLDFKFKNNTDYPIFIVAGYSNQKVTVDIYGMTLGKDVAIELESEVTEVIPQPSGVNYVLNPNLKPGEQKNTVTGRKGYKVDTYKVWYQAGKEIKRELLFRSTYKAYQETVEYNPR